eukprot:3829747-Heterocapsa_arctica.AAC.1
MATDVIMLEEAEVIGTIVPLSKERCYIGSMIATKMPDVAMLDVAKPDVALPLRHTFTALT